MQSPCRLLNRAQRLLVSLVFFCVLLSSSLVTAAQNDGLAAIEAMIDQGQHGQALTRLEPLLRQQPKHLSARFLRARALFAEGRGRAAQRLLQTLLREQSQWPEIHNNLAVIYAQQGDFDLARQQLEVALATHPGYQTAFSNLAIVYDRLASQAYRQALSPDETMALPDVQLAVIGHLPLPELKPESKPEPKPKLESQPKAIAPPSLVAGLGPDPKAIKRMIKAWAKAWSQQQSERYLGYYDVDFRPAAGLSRTDWAAKRRVRLGKPQFIRVRVDKINIAVVNEWVVSVSLRQHYESDRMNDTVIKNLILKKDQGQWRIFQENLVR